MLKSRDDLRGALADIDRTVFHRHPEVPEEWMIEIRQDLEYLVSKTKLLGDYINQVEERVGVPIPDVPLYAPLKV